MSEKLWQYFDKQSGLPLTAASFVLVGLIGILDYLTGYDLSVSSFYVIPIFLSTWFCGRQMGILTSALSVTMWFLTDLLAGHVYPHPGIPYWDALVRWGLFLVITYTLALLRTSQEKKEELIGELRTTLSKIKQLEGLLPICSFCKKIRDKNNQWHPLEYYISNHSEAQFSHTFCPRCGKEHYPEYFTQPTENPW